MRDPYASLGRELAKAARRQEAQSAAPGRLRAWFSHRLNAAVAAAVLLLSGSAVALAASGVLNGAPVKPEKPPSPVAGNGLPVSGAAGRLVLRTADPAGGLPWGMRVFHTTRGLLCVQVGRVQGGQLGELGLDSAFNDDGLFHALGTNVLGPGYGGGSANIECVTPGQTLIFEDANADRSAERLLPEEFREPPADARHRQIPPVRDLRALSYGLLGPHAVSVTYRTPAGMRTVPVRGSEGAFLLVERAGYIKNSSLVGGSMSGQAEGSSVDVIPARPPAFNEALVSAATFRFAGRLCSQGTGAPVRTRCPARRTFTPRRWFQPARNLHAPVHLTLLRQSPAACKAAFLINPCFKGEVEFTAPYAITAAGSDYDIQGAAKCKTGGRPETGWALERNVRRHEKVRTVSLGLFVFMPACAPHESFTVRYLNNQGPSRSAPHESIVIGTVALSQAKLPGGTRPAGVTVQRESPAARR
jgi:hypothetical protein